MKRKILDFPLQHARLVFIGLAVLTIGLGSAIPWIKVDTDPENMLPADEPVRVTHAAIKEEFNLNDFLVVGIVHEDTVFTPEILRRAYNITEALYDMEGVIVDDVLAPSEVIHGLLAGLDGVEEFVVVHRHCEAQRSNPGRSPRRPTASSRRQ